MDCRETQALLTAFHDGELPDADRNRVEGHLSRCPECARMLADMARADESAGVPDPGPGYWDRFNARVADRIEREEARPRAAVLRPKQGWMRQQLRFFIPAVAAAGLVVAVVRYGGLAPVAPKPPLPPAESVVEKSTPDLKGQRMAKLETEFPAAGKPGGATRPGSPPAESNRADVTPAAPPGTVATERIPSPGRKKPDRPVDRSLPEAKERSLRDAVAAPAELESPSYRPLPTDRLAPAAPPPVTADDARPMKAREEKEKMAAAAAPAAEPRHAAKAESTSGMRIGMEQVASEAPACETARALASQGLLREAEAAQRKCLERDSSPRAQENGLIFLAELLDRQARVAEADAVLADVRRQFPKSVALDQYRQQRPAVQKQQMPVPATR